MTKRYLFLVLEGVGVSFDRGHTVIHVPFELDRKTIFNQDYRSFHGQLRHSTFPVSAGMPKVGQKIRLAQTNGNISRPVCVDAVFTTPEITQHVPIKSLASHLEERDLLNDSGIAGLTSPNEFRFHSTLIRCIFRQAISAGSYTVNLKQVLETTHFPMTWLNDLAEAELVEVRTSKNTITILDPLAYLMMHAINRRKIMTGPIFSY